MGSLGSLIGGSLSSWSLSLSLLSSSTFIEVVVDKFDDDDDEGFDEFVDVGFVEVCGCCCCCGMRVLGVTE